MFFQSKYARYTIRSSYWFYCLFYRFLVFFFRRRLRMSSFFSYPKRARRRRRGEKVDVESSLFISIGGCFFQTYQALAFYILQGGFQFLLSLYPFSLLILLDDFQGDQAKRQQKDQPLLVLVVVVIVLVFLSVPRL